MYVCTAVVVLPLTPAFPFLSLYLLSHTLSHPHTFRLHTLTLSCPPPALSLTLPHYRPWCSPCPPASAPRSHPSPCPKGGAAEQQGHCCPASGCGCSTPPARAGDLRGRRDSRGAHTRVHGMVSGSGEGVDILAHCGGNNVGLL